MKLKKSIQLSEAFTAVLMLVLVGVLVIIAIVLFSSLKTSFPLESSTIVNESVDMSSGPTAVSNATRCGFQNFAVTGAINASDGVAIPTSNFTTGSTTGVITNTSIEFLTEWNVSYDYRWRGDACIASDSMITQFATYPVLVGLVGTIIFLGLVIGVLVASFLFGREAP